MIFLPAAAEAVYSERFLARLKKFKISKNLKIFQCIFTYAPSGDLLFEVIEFIGTVSLTECPYALAVSFAGKKNQSLMEFCSPGRSNLLERT